LVFRFSRELIRKVKILGDDKHIIFVRKAMERIGFKTTKNEDTDYTITVISDNAIPVWHVRGPKLADILQFHLPADLILFDMNIRINKFLS